MMESLSFEISLRDVLHVREIWLSYLLLERMIAIEFIQLLLELNLLQRVQSGGRVIVNFTGVLFFLSSAICGCNDNMVAYLVNCRHVHHLTSVTDHVIEHSEPTEEDRAAQSCQRIDPPGIWLSMAGSNHRRSHNATRQIAKFLIHGLFKK